MYQPYVRVRAIKINGATKTSDTTQESATKLESMEMAANIDDNDTELTEAKEANEKEKEWWSIEDSLGYLDVGEER